MAFIAPHAMPRVLVPARALGTSAAREGPTNVSMQLGRFLKVCPHLIYVISLQLKDWGLARLPIGEGWRNQWQGASVFPFSTVSFITSGLEQGWLPMAFWKSLLLENSACSFGGWFFKMSYSSWDLSASTPFPELGENPDVLASSSWGDHTSMAFHHEVQEDQILQVDEVRGEQSGGHVWG